MAGAKGPDSLPPLRAPGRLSVSGAKPWPNLFWLPKPWPRHGEGGGRSQAGADAGAGLAGVRPRCLGRAKEVGASRVGASKVPRGSSLGLGGLVALLIAINGSKRGSRRPPGPGWNAEEGRAVPALRDLPGKSPATTCAVLVISPQKMIV